MICCLTDRPIDSEQASYELLALTKHHAPDSRSFKKMMYEHYSKPHVISSKIISLTSLSTKYKILSMLQNIR